MTAPQQNFVQDPDNQAAARLAQRCAEILIENRPNMATAFTTLAMLLGDTFFHMERVGVTYDKDHIFSQIRRVCDSQQTLNRAMHKFETNEVAGRA